MGQCASICNKTNFGMGEITVENLDCSKVITKGQVDEKYSRSPNYAKIIYLQNRIKRFLKSKKRKHNKQRSSEYSIYVKSFNPNQSNSHNNPVSTEISNQNSPHNNTNINTNNNSQHLQTKNNNNTSAATEQRNDCFCVIPSVKVEFKNSDIFSQDPFLKNKRIPIETNDPRQGPYDDKRRIFPLVSEDDSSYIGQWKNGKRDGLGVLCWKDVSKYIGEFIEDKVIGFGKLIREEGDSYVGQWNNFQAQGIGKYTSNREAIYQGYWNKDKQDGFGMESWPKGSTYSGEYINGNKEGIGMLLFDNNGGYLGEFSNGCLSGIGTFYFNDERKYEGEWRNNKMNGFGRITWPDGKFYEGEFQDDKKVGFGVFFSPKRIYMGMWVNSSLEGDTIIIDNGVVKKQFWENGRASKNLPPDKPIFFEKLVDEIMLHRDNVYYSQKN
jgi:hypothetical protein